MLLGGNFGVAGGFAAVASLICRNDGVKAVISGAEGNTDPATVGIRMCGVDAAEGGAG